jgi:hypothetical protein
MKVPAQGIKSEELEKIPHNQTNFGCSAGPYQFFNKMVENIRQFLPHPYIQFQNKEKV